MIIPRHVLATIIAVGTVVAVFILAVGHLWPGGEPSAGLPFLAASWALLAAGATGLGVAVTGRGPQR